MRIENDRKKVFLSHRLADRAIADVVRQHLGIWGFDNSVFQASAPGQGPSPGTVITEEIKKALYGAKLVILIYTLTDYDWAFCMWECGLATHPKNPDTKTVVFQCNRHNVPRIFEGQVLVKVDEDGIRDFVTQFHKHLGFFPSEPAVRPDIQDEILEMLSSNFFNDLKAVIPPGTLEQRHRWDFLSLQMTAADVAALRNDRNCQNQAVMSPGALSLAGC